MVTNKDGSHSEGAVINRDFNYLKIIFMKNKFFKKQFGRDITGV